MDPARRPFFTEAMYLAMERVAEEKHELYRGDIWAMAAGSPRHNKLAMACGVQLGAALRGRDCAPLTSDQRIHVPATGSYCYPDISVVCGEPTYHTADPDSITNPRLIVEALSRTTEKHDRTSKFGAGSRIELGSIGATLDVDELYDGAFRFKGDDA